MLDDWNVGEVRILHNHKEVSKASSIITVQDQLIDNSQEQTLRSHKNSKKKKKVKKHTNAFLLQHQKSTMGAADASVKSQFESIGLNKQMDLKHPFTQSPPEALL